MDTTCWTSWEAWLIRLLTGFRLSSFWAFSICLSHGTQSGLFFPSICFHSSQAWNISAWIAILLVEYTALCVATCSSFRITGTGPFINPLTGPHPRYHTSDCKRSRNLHAIDIVGVVSLRRSDRAVDFGGWPNGGWWLSDLTTTREIHCQRWHTWAVETGFQWPSWDNGLVSLVGVREECWGNSPQLRKKDMGKHSGKPIAGQPTFRETYSGPTHWDDLEAQVDTRLRHGEARSSSQLASLNIPAISKQTRICTYVYKCRSWMNDTQLCTLNSYVCVNTYSPTITTHKSVWSMLGILAELSKYVYIYIHRYTHNNSSIWT